MCVKENKKKLEADFDFACKMSKNWGFKFADVSDIKNLGRREWSSSAPEWRQAKPGLCLEGICDTSHCKAYGKMVIMNHGFTKEEGFVLEEESWKLKCPICGLYVEPTTCAFNNCDWKVEGKKFSSLREPPKLVQQERFTRADDAYFVFDDNIKATWLTLKMIAVPNGQGGTSGHQTHA